MGNYWANRGNIVWDDFGGRTSIVDLTDDRRGQEVHDLKRECSWLKGTRGSRVPGEKSPRSTIMTQIKKNR